MKRIVFFLKCPTSSGEGVHKGWVSGGLPLEPTFLYSRHSGEGRNPEFCRNGITATWEYVTIIMK